MLVLERRELKAWYWVSGPRSPSESVRNRDQFSPGLVSRAALTLPRLLALWFSELRLTFGPGSRCSPRFPGSYHDFPSAPQSAFPDLVHLPPVSSCPHILDGHCPAPSCKLACFQPGSVYALGPLRPQESPEGTRGAALLLAPEPVSLYSLLRSIFLCLDQSLSSLLFCLTSLLLFPLSLPALSLPLFVPPSLSAPSWSSWGSALSPLLLSSPPLFSHSLSLTLQHICF